MTEIFSAYLDAAWEAADAAGRIICASWQKPKTVDYKGVIDLVTDTDRQCEHAIVEVLTQRFPHHAILAEEETRLQRHESPYRWIVDPLDGTTNFAHGYPHFCVSIALERANEVILGSMIRSEASASARSKITAQRLTGRAFAAPPSTTWSELCSPRDSLTTGAIMPIII